MKPLHHYKSLVISPIWKKRRRWRRTQEEEVFAGFQRLLLAYSSQSRAFRSPVNTDMSKAKRVIPELPYHSIQLTTHLWGRKVGKKSAYASANSPDLLDMAAESLGSFVLVWNTCWTFLTLRLCFHQKQFLRICCDKRDLFITCRAFWWSAGSALSRLLLHLYYDYNYLHASDTHCNQLYLCDSQFFTFWYDFTC